MIVKNNILKRPQERSQSEHLDTTQYSIPKVLCGGCVTSVLSNNHHSYFLISASTPLHISFQGAGLSKPQDFHLYKCKSAVGALNHI